MPPSSRRLLSIAILAALIIGALGAPALAASVTFKVKGEYAKRTQSGCGRTRHYHIFHRGSTIEFEGYVSPVPAAHSSAAVHVMKCVRGRFVAAGTVPAEVKGPSSAHPGKYKAFVNVSRYGRFDVAYVTYGGLHTQNEYFAVTR